MTTSNRRPASTMLCVLLMTNCPLWTACNVTVSGGGGSGGSSGSSDVVVVPAGDDDADAGTSSGSLTLSTGAVAPGGLLTVSHSGIAAGSIVEVEFTGPNGFAVIVEGVDTQNGSTRIAAPPLMNLTTGQVSAGQVTVSVKGLTGQASLTIDDLPQLGNLEPGTIVAFFLQITIEELQAVRTDVAQIEADFPGAVTGTSGVVLIDEQIRDLQATIAQLENGVPITVELPDGGQATLTADDLQFADRWLASMLDGLQQAALNSPAGKRVLADPELKGLLSLRSSDECLELALDSAGAQAVKDCFGEVVGDVRSFTGRGTNLAATLATGVGLTVAVLGGGAVALLGGVVAVVGFSAGTVNAMMLGQNTDAFLNNDAEGFSFGQEIASQVGRFGIGVFTFLPTVAISINDLLDGAKTEKCLAGQQNRRFQLDPGVASFCEFDPPADDGPDPGGEEPECTINLECAVGEICDGGACVAEPTSDCPTDAFCDLACAGTDPDCSGDGDGDDGDDGGGGTVACCRGSNDNCTEDYTAEVCVSICGVPNPPGVTCDEVVCNNPSVPCCFPPGSPNFPVGGCSQYTKVDCCIRSGGTPLAEGEDCNACP